MRPDERRDIAYQLADTWMTMVFRHGFFHSDPHPANIFVLESGELGLVDFGQAGKLTDDDMAKLTRALRRRSDGERRRDPAPAARARRSLRTGARAGVPDRAPVLFDRYYGTRLSDIDPIQVIREGFQLIYSMNLRLPSRFVMLDKAIATLASVGQEVYPDFNVFEVAKPYARGLLADRFHPRRRSRKRRPRRWRSARVAREHAVPGRATCSSGCATGRSRSTSRTPGIDEIDDHIDKATNRIAVALVILGGLMGSAIIGVFATGGPHVRRAPPARVHRLRALRRLRGLARLGGPPPRAAVGSHGHVAAGRLRKACHGSAAKDIWREPHRRASVGGMPSAVLVAEPEPETREYLGRQLRDDGFDVLGAARRSEALELAERARPDLVLLAELDLCLRLRRANRGARGTETCP